MIGTTKVNLGIGQSPQTSPKMAKGTECPDQKQLIMAIHEDNILPKSTIEPH
jgi:hypothetical protein